MDPLASFPNGIPILSQPSIPLDPLKAARLREAALLKIKQTPTSDAKGDFRAMPGLEASPDLAPGNPNAGVMPPLPSQDVSEPPGGVTAEPANASEETGSGPTDIRPKPDSTSATPVAAAADPLEAELGGDPSQKKSGSFWQNPASSDALIAFGAAMLKAPNFNTGLANGAEAVTKALEPYKMPTQADVARATLAARLKRYASGTGTESHKGFSTATTVYGPNREMYIGALNQNTGKMEWHDINGNTVEKLPPGTMDRRDTGFDKASDLAAKANDEAISIAMDAPGTLANIDTVQKSFLSAGGGPGAINAGKRYIGDIMGWSNGFFGDLSDRQVLNSVLKKMEIDAAQTQRGLGQLTEGERAILREALPSLASDPKAFWRITEVMRLKAERARDVANSWDDLSDNEKAQYKGDMRRYAAKKWDVDNNYQQRLQELRTAKVPSFMTQEQPATQAPGATGAPTGLSPNARKYF